MSLVKPGKNHLTIAVTNLLINHVSGMKTLPGVPPELASRYGETTDRYTGGSQAFKREQNFAPLPPSGDIPKMRSMKSMALSSGFGMVRRVSLFSGRGRMSLFAVWSRMPCRLGARYFWAGDAAQYTSNCSAPEVIHPWQ